MHELMIISIKIFPSILFGIKVELFGQFAKDIKQLDTCTLFLSLLVKHFICVFCLPWLEVTSII